VLGDEVTPTKVEQVVENPAETCAGGRMRAAGVFCARQVCQKCEHVARTAKARGEMRDALRPVLSADDEVFIADITDAEAAWRGFPARGTQWLENNLA